MSWIYKFIFPDERYTWAQVRILKETDKAILITAPFVIASEAKQSQNGNIKIWIPKSRIYAIRLRNNELKRLGSDLNFIFSLYC